MKNPFKNIFNNIKNKLQKIRKKNDKAPEVDKKIKIEETENELEEINKIKQPTNELEEKKEKTLMQPKEIESRSRYLFEDLNNNFNFYKNQEMFSSIRNIKIFTEEMIARKFYSDTRCIDENHINFLEYSIIKELFTKPNFKLPDVKIEELNVYFPNNLTNELILEKRDESNDRREINKNFINILKVYATIFEKEKAQNLLDEFFTSKTDEFFTSKTEVLQKKEVQNVLDALYSPENFENIEERATPKKSFFQITTANTPKASIIPKFIHRTATTGLAHQ